MEPISVFDMFKIGVGPSSSHTLGPWRAAAQFVAEIKKAGHFEQTHRVEVTLYGSLALTGKGHGTDIAILLGLSGQDPETIPLDQVHGIPQSIEMHLKLQLADERTIPFYPEKDMIFHFDEVLPGHANGLVFRAFDAQGDQLFRGVYYSVGGGFVVKEGEALEDPRAVPPFPIHTSADLMRYCLEENAAVWELVLINERTWNPRPGVKNGLLRIWEVMRECVYKGCHTDGELPGGLHVSRRAAAIRRKLMGHTACADGRELLDALRRQNCDFSQVIKWVGCFAMAVNEENANFGRVVTSPTNGAAGVIPAVLFYYLAFVEREASEEDIVRFLLTAGVSGSIFKQGATISAAMGGCQAEIGVSSAMAAAALTESLGGSVGQALMAAEIAMEHHLGLTCDPVGGLVQVPCIERNSMGAMKAITAANIALESDPGKAKVTLDAVVKAMWETAQDMNHKYKETSLGGLAAHIAISVPEC
ncbi:MAG TPA: L-serine ammonia-lyase [Flavilitoribacter sp.]|nr:L-serine ammonia-lyase [Flavilitoribacter sp.]